MKIKEIINLCKKSNRLIIYEDTECQWLSDGSAIYPLYGLPKFNIESLCRTFDIDVKKAEKMQITDEPLPECYDFSNLTRDEYEKTLTPYFLSFNFLEKEVTPYQTKNEILLFIESKYLKPLKDGSENINVIMRETDSGTYYAALVIGWDLYGICPFENDIITDDFINKLKEMQEFCKKTAESKTMWGGKV